MRGFSFFSLIADVSNCISPFSASWSTFFVYTLSLLMLGSWCFNMAVVVRNLLQKLPDQRILTYFNNGNPLTLLPRPINQQPKFDNFNPLLVNPDDSNNCTRVFAEYNPRNAFQFYPSFSFQYFLNPVSPSGFCQSQSLEQNLESEESRTMWADSVKKKRKRKMNKHKLRKLRKRLRGYSWNWYN